MTKELHSFRNSLIYLINRYNRYSAPYVLRTDHEHRRARAIARESLRRIEAKYREGVDYREFDNGALWPNRD